MFVYNKKLQYPVKIDKPNPKLASIIISQYGGPDGELGASLRYLSQRYSMPFDELKGLLTDIGIEDKNCAFQKNLQTVKKPMRKYSKNHRLLQMIIPDEATKNQRHNLWSIVIICFIAFLISLV